MPFFRDSAGLTESSRASEDKPYYIILGCVAGAAFLIALYCLCKRRCAVDTSTHSERARPGNTAVTGGDSSYRAPTVPSTGSYDRNAYINSDPYALR